MTRTDAARLLDEMLEDVAFFERMGTPHHIAGDGVRERFLDLLESGDDNADLVVKQKREVEDLKETIEDLEDQLAAAERRLEGLREDAAEDMKAANDIIRGLRAQCGQ